MMMFVLQEGGDGTANDGGTNLHTFAKDGGRSYLVHHPI